jgi:ABC-2 type transport system permease protein
MKGLLFKDWVMLRKHGSVFLLFALALLGASALDGGIAGMLCAGGLAGAALPVTLMNGDEQNGWSTFCRALPYSAAQLVSVKYVLVLLLSAALALAGGLAQGIRAVWMGGFDLPAVLGGAGAAAAMCGLAPAMQLPVLFRFGVEKGERVCVAQIGVLLLLLLLAALAVCEVRSVPAVVAAFGSAVSATFVKFVVESARRI